MVDIVDSKSTALKACGFDSHLPYHIKRIGLISLSICFFFIFFSKYFKNKRVSHTEFYGVLFLNKAWIKFSTLLSFFFK